LAIAAVAVLGLASTANAAVISFLGSDEITATAWRSTSVVKPSAYDPNGDNAYGNDGYYAINSGSGAGVPVVSALPSYIASVTDHGGRYNHTVYPDFDNPALPIGPTVGDVNAGIFYADTSGVVPILDFALAQNTEFVLTIPLVGDNINHRPTALSVTQTVGGTATASAVVPTPASGDAVNYLFFDVAGSAGDAFDVVINGPATIHGIGGVAFESPPVAVPYSTMVLNDNPHGYWRLGESVMPTAFDSGPNTLHGSYAQFSPPDGLPTLGVPGIPGGGADTAVQFNGTTPVSQVYVADGAHPTDYTLEAWVKVDPGTTSTPVALINRTASNPFTTYSHSLAINNGRFEHYTWDGNARLVWGPATIQPDEWYHVVGLYHPGAPGYMSLYVNGVLAMNWVGNLGNPWAGGSQWRFAAPSGRYPNWFDGVMDEVAIYHHLLSPGQILAHYEAGIAPAIIPEPSTFLIWALGLLGLAAYARRRRK
jgi:MYXO-CTERM domain-containing protein